LTNHRGINLNVHKDRRLRAFIDAHDWITVFYLPPYAPDLNPVEGIWSLLRRSSQANTAFTDPDHLIGVLRQGLRQIQCGWLSGRLTREARRPLRNRGGRIGLSLRRRTVEPAPRPPAPPGEPGPRPKAGCGSRREWADIM